MHTLIWIGIFLVVFWGVIYLLSRLYDFDSINLEFNPGVLMWRTERGIGVLDRIARTKERFWSFAGNLSAVLGTGFMFAFFGFLTYSVISYIMLALGPSGPPPVPSGAETKIVPIPGLNIPLFYGGIALASVLFIHEGAHGIILRNLKIKVESVGLALFVLIPGAFVEQNDEEFEEASPVSRMKVASAGPIANIILAFACFGLVLAFVSPQPGVPIQSVVENTPAEEAGLSPGLRITGIDDDEFFNFDDFDEFMDTTRPGQTITVRTDEEQYQVTLTDDPYDNESGYIGIATYFGPLHDSTLAQPQNLFFSLPISTIFGTSLINQAVYNSVIPWFLVNVLVWIFTLNVLVAVFNLLPLKPLDGGHLFEGLAERYTSGRTKDTLVNVVRSIVIFIILTNVLALIGG